MLPPAEDILSSGSQSRRFACDRCHRHKLRCEKTPVVVNGNVVVPLGACKRCLKAGVACETNVSNTCGSKRKLHQSSAEGFSTENHNHNHSHNNNNNNDGSMMSPIDHHSLFGGGDDNTSSLLELEHFDFESGEFGSLHDNSHAASPDRVHFPSQSPPVTSTSTMGDELARPQHSNGKTGAGRETPEFGNLAAYEVSPPPPAADSLIGGRDQGFLQGSSRAAAASPREGCVQQILELQSLLFQGLLLHATTEVELGEALFSPAGDTSIPPRDADVSELSLFRRMLFASERLLELFTTLKAVASSTATPASAAAAAAAMTLTGQASPAGSRGNNCGGNGNGHDGRKRRYMHFSDDDLTDSGDGWDSSPGSSSTSTDGVSLCSSHRQSGVRHVGSMLRRSLPLLSAAAPPPRSSSSSASSAGLSPPSAAWPSPVDLPVTVSFLTCYVGLLCVYRTVLTHLYDVLRAYVVSGTAPMTASRSCCGSGSGSGAS
ncbi:hypothetical protein B0J12DRAFT_412300 [Macrophomina phaseolina]|uniref:Zn(2)-C6 fungal-type domain-containing protein n=1 Tax=Macrophomina phaseolina TaxID=35725 RepID=A0ABQ8GJC1_9PEZI|nr:hypothetical protein B0J12DRAFT_412300 [Macrophomina phaseolina]